MLRIEYFKSHSDEWFKEREKVITGTSLAEKFGLEFKLDPVIAEKYKEQIAASKIWGRVLENGIFVLMNELGIKVEPAGEWNEVCFISENEFGASLDGLINPLRWKQDPETGNFIDKYESIPVECKTVVESKWSKWKKAPPLHNLIQIHLQMMLLESEYGLITCLCKKDGIINEKGKIESPFKQNPPLIIYKVKPNLELYQLFHDVANSKKQKANKKQRELLESIIYNDLEKIYES